MGLQEELAKMAEWMEQDKRENGENIGYDKLKFPGRYTFLTGPFRGSLPPDTRPCVRP